MNASRFFRDESGNLKIAQWPNPPILTVVGLSAAGLLAPSRSETLGWMTRGALCAWAADEVLRGASPFRRTMGGAVLAFCIWQAAA
ncbi:MAG: hypothetical protein ACTHOG_00705 [Marmoricola sp.]